MSDNAINLADNDIVTKVVAATVKPGAVVKIDNAGKFAATGTGDGKERLFVLNANFSSGGTADDDITANSTAEGFVFKPGQTRNVQMEAGTYTDGQKLTLGASGRMKSAASGNIVVGYVASDGVPEGAVTAGTRIAVVICDRVIA